VYVCVHTIPYHTIVDGIVHNGQIVAYHTIWYTMVHTMPYAYTPYHTGTYHTIHTIHYICVHTIPYVYVCVHTIPYTYILYHTITYVYEVDTLSHTISYHTIWNINHIPVQNGHTVNGQNITKYNKLTILFHSITKRTFWQVLRTS
jgi:hypothetical protein